MEQMAHRMAQKIGHILNSDSEQIAVMAYGLTALLQLIFIFAAATLFGVVFGFFWEAMIVFFSVGFLRRLIGGAHSQSFTSCLIVSILCIALFSALAHDVFPLLGNWFTYVFSAIVYLLASIWIYRLAPVDSPNKPVRAPQKIHRLRRSACLVMVVFILLTAWLCVMQGFGWACASLVFALDLSVLWQAVMLTKAGHHFIHAIDRLFIGD